MDRLTDDQARIVFKMAKMALNAYRREVEAGVSRGNYMDEQKDALRALAGEFTARFPGMAKDGYFAVPRHLRGEG